MLKKLINISANSLKRKNLFVMADKVITRVKERSAANENALALDWIEQNAEDLESFLNEINAPLWQACQKEAETIGKDCQAKIDKLGLDLGGGGHYPLLYFWVKHLQPNAVIETGVAAGWSSQAILKALNSNEKQGKLFSSDFPYFRLENPEQYVGYVVDEDLKENWSLFINGDQNNLPLIIDALTSKVDLFHYDSDKSIKGRDYAWAIVEPHLSDNAVVIFDDIQDNAHFMNFVAERTMPFKIFEFGGKYIGITGPYFNTSN